MKTLIVLVILAIIALFYFMEKKRSDELETAAKQMGFDIERDGQKLPEHLRQASFYLFTQGAPQTRNLMHGQREGYQIILGEYFYDAAFGDEADPHLPNSDDDDFIERRAQMFAWVTRSGTRLPEFDLSPTDSSKRSAATNAGFHAVSFDNAARFNKVFNLAGHDEQMIRTVFTEEFRDLLLERPELVMESRGDQWLFYTPDNRVPASELNGFVDYITQLLNEASDKH